LKTIVSVIIPTRNRPKLVQRAVKSALAQTLQEIEVIVVIDGLDELTRSVLAQINDERLKVIESFTNQGCCAARDLGVSHAVSEWIALLDDDDEWMPQKLELQLAAAKASKYKYPIVSSFLIAHTSSGNLVYPRRIPGTEPLSEYLFVRNTLFQGEGLLQSSTLLAPKELLQQIPFSVNGPSMHDDWEWVLRAITLKSVGIEFVEQTLSIWHLEQSRPSLSRNYNWQSSLLWLRTNRDLFTPRAYSSFILAEVSARAAINQDWQAFIPLLIEAVKLGKPTPKDICLYFGMWLLSPSIRSFLRNLLTKKPSRGVYGVGILSRPYT
jgi:glycosyltransferase involved in cell wall biosynthesis